MGILQKRVIALRLNLTKANASVSQGIRESESTVVGPESTENGSSFTRGRHENRLLMFGRKRWPRTPSWSAMRKYEVLDDHGSISQDMYKLL